MENKISKAGKIIIASIITAMLIAGGIFVSIYVKPNLTKLNFVRLVADSQDITVPDQIDFQGETIPLLWADNNDGEDLIIKSDRQYYDANEQTDVFFSVGNQTSSDQKTDIYFWFDGADKTIASAEGLSSGGRRQPLKIENCKLNENCKLEIKNLSRKDVKGYTQGSKFQDTISANQTSYYRAAVEFPKGASGEFFIEAFGVSPECRNIYGYSPKTKKSAKNADFWGYGDKASQDSLSSNQKATNNGGFGDLELVPESGLSTYNQYSNLENLVKPFLVDSQKAVEAPGIEPGRSWLISPTRFQPAPTAFSSYHNQNTSQPNRHALWAANIAYADEQISSDCDVIAYGHLDPYYASGLVGMWSFNGQDTNWTSATAGTTNDLSGNGNTGTMTNMSRSSSPVPGISGQALNFDGVDDYVNIAANSSINDMATATISMWFKVKDLTTSGSFLIKDPGDTSALNIYPYSDQRLQLTRKYSGDDLYIICTASSFALNEWTHVAATFAGMNGSNGHMYFNGVECGYDARSSATGALSSDAAGPLRISSSQQAGSFDEVRVYNRALSASEVAELYRLGAARMKVNTPITKAGSQSGLVGNWTFNGQDIDWQTNTAYDRSGSGNNGTITNMSTTTSPVPGVSGQALNFDGVDDYVSMGDVFYSDLFTVCVWAKADILKDDQNDLVIKRNSSGITAGDMEWQLQVEANGVGGPYIIWFDSWNSYQDSSLKVSGNTSLLVNKWYHFCGVQNGDGNTGYVYLNGVQDGSAMQTGAMINSISLIQIGVRTLDNDNRYWDGLIDEVRVYNRALSASEVAELYRLGARRMEIRQ